LLFFWLGVVVEVLKDVDLKGVKGVGIGGVGVGSVGVEGSS